MRIKTKKWPRLIRKTPLVDKATHWWSWINTAKTLVFVWLTVVHHQNQNNVFVFRLTSSVYGPNAWRTVLQHVWKPQSRLDRFLRLANCLNPSRLIPFFRSRRWGDGFSCRAGEGMLGQDSPVGSHVSTGLGTMLLGVSGNCDDKEVTSLPDELPKEPDSENETCGRGRIGNQ